MEPIPLMRGVWWRLAAFVGSLVMGVVSANYGEIVAAMIWMLGAGMWFGNAFMKAGDNLHVGIIQLLLSRLEEHTDEEADE